MKPRKIIYECHAGSFLYGTNRPDSDQDYMGVFLPSTEDLFSMSNCPSEWTLDEKKSEGERNTVGDVDRKYYSLQKYLNLLAQGQPKQLEMLFAPENMTITKTSEWEIIYNNKDLFLSKNFIEPFVGFAKAQAYKSTLKGDNLNKIRNIISKLDDMQALRWFNEFTVDTLITHNLSEDTWTFLQEYVDVEEVQYRPGVMMSCMKIAGRKFEFTQSLKNVLNKLKELESKYGERSETAAEKGIDTKSLMHAYRLLFESEQFLRNGKLILPLPRTQCEFLLSIRSGNYSADFLQEIEDKLTEIKKIDSSLPDKVDWSKINKLCQQILMEYHNA